MSYHDEDIFPPDNNNDDDDFEDLSETIVQESVKPPEDLKLTIEVGLTQYSPNGLLELIAKGLMKSIGGTDQWSRRLETKLLKLGTEQARELVSATVKDIYSGTKLENFEQIVRSSVGDWLEQRVNRNGQVSHSSYRDNDIMTRQEYIVRQVVQESIDAAFKDAEKEWRQTTQAAIKETLAEMMAARLTKSLPTPPELK